MTLAALIAGWFLLLPSDFAGLGKAAASQSVFGANINYWLELNYFAGSAREKPLLHTWSLAVEEQFYLIMPFLLWAVFRLKNSRATVLSVLVAIFLGSFALSVYGVANYPSATFYLLPFRTWELLTGSILAFLPAAVTVGRRISRELTAFAGMLLVVIPMFAYTSSTPFPGIAALFPCLGTALLIWSNNAPTFLGSVLSTRPFVFIGLISYSLYLWHWLFFSFARYIALEPFTLAFKWRVALVALSFIVAALSWKFVETPFRTRKIAGTRKAVFAFAAAGLIAVFVVGTACIILKGFPQRFSGEKLEYAIAATDFEFKNEVSADDVRFERLVTIGNPESSTQVLVWGDSHAMAAIPAFDALLKEKGIAGRAVTHSATAPVVGWYLPNEAGLGKESLVFGDEVISYIRRNQIQDVVLAAHWAWYLEKDGFRPALISTIRQITESGARVWILTDVPQPGFNVPRALAFDYSEDYLRSLRPRQTEFGTEFISEIKSVGGFVLNPKSVFKDANDNYIIESGGVALYTDGDHLTTKGAKMILLPFLRNSFAVN
jgi:peptidoglycan/LPS O-acetylase OafA/YrhL